MGKEQVTLFQESPKGLFSCIYYYYWCLLLDGDPKITCESQFSPSTVWISEIKLKTSFKLGKHLSPHKDF